MLKGTMVTHYLVLWLEWRRESVPASELRLIKRCAEFRPRDEVKLVPHNTRGIYVLLERNLATDSTLPMLGWQAVKKLARMEGCGPIRQTRLRGNYGLTSPSSKSGTTSHRLKLQNWRDCSGITAKVERTNISLMSWMAFAFSNPDVSVTMKYPSPRISSHLTSRMYLALSRRNPSRVSLTICRESTNLTVT